MVGCKIEAILIKVAALGLEPAMHLGKTIAELKDHLRRMSDRFGNNVCGEGDSLVRGYENWMGQTFFIGLPSVMDKHVSRPEI